ncbi:snaclec bothroinsularin subunit beta-like [Asterias amurensis]|uniref:snaclec bothroinsularin subunit beta-like n=1 Tax=Asterias amurensis TaxID=7602 RepID=UPI003AB7C3C1
MMHLASVVLLLVGCYATLAAICPTDWQRYGESCYLLITQRMNWTEANDTCVESNAALAVPNSQIEQTFIWSMFKEFFNGSQPTRQLWIGCYFDQETDEWQHCPLRDVHNTYENWKRSQPDNNTATGCVIMRRDRNGKWADTKCSKNHFAVCELQVDTTPRSFCLETGPDGRIKSQCLVGHVMKEVRAVGVVSCGWACRSEPRCRSFNLLMEQGPGKMVCQLNNATLHEAAKDMELQDQCYSFDL